MVYIFIIVGGMAMITLSNWLMDPTVAEAGELALSTLFGTVSVIAWDGIVALLIRRLPLPKSWFAPERRIFYAGKRERAFYRRIGIQAWKQHVPELGCFTGFSKSEFTSPRDTRYLACFLMESNYGVAIHLANALLGFLIILLPYCSSPSIALPIALVNLVLSLLPVAILRFNGAPMYGIYMKQQKKAQKNP
jgi:hypothetical protein